MITEIKSTESGRHSKDLNRGSRGERPRASSVCFAMLMLLSLASGCGVEEGSNLPGFESNTHGPAVDQTEALNRLGVDTKETPRVDNKGREIPRTYGPLGGTRTIDAKAELYVAGVEATPNNIATLYDDFSCLTGDNACGQDDINSMVLATRAEVDAPWMRESLGRNSNPETRRATAAADIDGDGFDEIITAYVSNPDKIRLQITDDASDGYAVRDVLVGQFKNVSDVSLVGGDFEGSGAAQLALGICTPDGAAIWFLAEENGTFVAENDSSIQLARLIEGSSMSLNLTAGNIDYDNAHELVATLNEIKGQCDPIADSRYFIFDDATTGHKELDSGPVQARDQAGALKTSVVSDVSLGDIDGDGLDEVVFAGLTKVPSCSFNDCDPTIAVLIARDDAISEFAGIGARSDDFSIGGCEVAIRFLHVNAADVDGDNFAEVQVNHVVFEDWKQAAPWTRVEAYTMSKNVLYGDWNENQRYTYDKTTSAIVTGDVTGDGRENVIVTGWDDDVPQVVTYGIVETGETKKMTRLHSMPVGNGSNPMLVVANVDADSTVLKFQEGSHSLEYTEPIVLAVLAAPPCYENAGQNTDACRTTFGNGSSVSAEYESAFTVSAGVVVGISVEDRTFTQSAIDLTASLKVKATISASASYALEKTVARSSGPLEDSVIFLTQPMDRYVYTILSHVDPGLIGRTVDIWLPREPIVILAEREFYNDSITEGSIRIDKTVLKHNIGDPRSYPTREEKNKTMLVTIGNPLLQNGPHSVGQGAGDIEVDLDVSSEFSAGRSLALEYEFEAETTIAGVKVGANFGFEAEASFTLTTGSSTSYSGVVGNIDATNFQEQQYSFGLFTYRHIDPGSGRQFEVINYWVE